jgi:hypothetical protein
MCSLNGFCDGHHLLFHLLPGLHVLQLLVHLRAKHDGAQCAAADMPQAARGTGDSSIEGSKHAGISTCLRKSVLSKQRHLFEHGHVVLMQEVVAEDLLHPIFI